MLWPVVILSMCVPHPHPSPISFTPSQLIHGVHGLKPSEPVIDFVKKHHAHFTGGIYFVSGAVPEFMEAAEHKISQVRPSFTLLCVLYIYTYYAVHMVVSLKHNGMSFSLSETTPWCVVIHNIAHNPLIVVWFQQYSYRIR